MLFINRINDRTTNRQMKSKQLDEGWKAIYHPNGVIELDWQDGEEKIRFSGYASEELIKFCKSLPDKSHIPFSPIAERVKKHLESQHVFNLDNGLCKPNTDNACTACKLLKDL